MKRIAKYQGREVFWLDFSSFETTELPADNWICLATSDVYPDDGLFERFIRASISKGLLEFKGHGEYGELLHDMFDHTMVDIEITENRETIDIGTTWHNNEPLADAFWQCFFATALPLRTNYGKLKIVCTDLTGADRAQELKGYIERFEQGWMPEN